MKKLCIVLLTNLTISLFADVFDKMPAGCFVVKRIPIEESQVDVIGKRLGYQLKELSNTVVSIYGRQIQVNIIETSNQKDAKALHKTLSVSKGNPHFCLLKRNQVIEFYGNNLTTADVRKTAFELGFVKKPKAVAYQVKGSVTPISQADYMVLDLLFNLLLSSNDSAKIAALVDRIEFGDELAILKGDYKFDPKPVSRKKRDDHTVYQFSNFYKKHNIPFINFNFKKTVSSTAFTPSKRVASSSLTSATEFWPCNDQSIRYLAQQITRGKTSQKAKLKAILEWLKPGENISYEGQVGSRYGVKQVLKQRYGRCWDFSDCFMTLARSVGIPCRQLGGWLYGASGDVWAEVLVEGKGWQQVEPTGGTLVNCGIYHIPYFVTEDGDMPILYTSMPTVEIKEVK